MNVALEIERLMRDDIDDVIAWGSRISLMESQDAYKAAASIVFSSSTLPISKVKGLALLQAIVHQYPNLKRMDLTWYVDGLANQIETTEHPEFQYWCSQVMAELLADCLLISDRSFDNGISLLRCLMRTSVHPYSREFIRAAFSTGTPLKKRLHERMITRRLPVWAFLSKLATPHRQVSQEHARKYGIDWVSFGDFIRDEAKNLGLDYKSVRVLQNLGQRLVTQDPEGLCEKVLGQAPDWEPGLPIVVDGVRHRKIFEALKSIVAPCSVVLQRLDVEPSTWEMMLERKLGDSNAIEEAKSDPTEQEVEELSSEAVPVGYIEASSVSLVA